jgi:hypothetical protein
MVQTRRQALVPVQPSGERADRSPKPVLSRVLVDAGAAGVDLAGWLAEHSRSLANSRTFYVIQARSDREAGVYKIGFSNTDSAARLKSYLNTYGRGNVTLHILIRSGYNVNVTRERSAMYGLEQRVKRQFAAQIAALDRGAERLAVPIKRTRQAVRLDRVDEGGQMMDLVDQVTAVVKNRSRRLRALRGGSALPAGVGRG